ncbi:MAG: prealbumin-like fold domain-containing protein [Ruminococcus sp.]
MVTDKEGKAVLNNLPIGKYYVVEEKAGQNCVLDSEAKEFEIAYKGQEVAVDYVTMELTNQRRKFPESSEERRRNRKTAGRSGIRAVCAGGYQKCCQEVVVEEKMP